MVGKILVKNHWLRRHFQRFWSKIFKKSKNGKAEKVASAARPWQPPTWGFFGPSSPFSFFVVCRPPAARSPRSKTWKSEGGVSKFRPWWLTQTGSASRLWICFAPSVVFVFFFRFGPPAGGQSRSKSCKSEEGVINFQRHR